MATPLFANGFWTWDEGHECLKFNSRETSKLTKGTSATTLAVTTNFKEHIDNVEQVKFKRNFQRQCKPDEPNVVTLQDVKDVALFIANPDSLTQDFINYFHIPTMDRFLRALIVYFQYYVQVWDNMMKRRNESRRKLWQPVVLKNENTIRDDLADLRSMVAREYCSIIVGKCDAKRFHHMKESQSLSSKDRLRFERLICIAARVVWIALERKNLSLIGIFNMALHNIGHVGVAWSTNMNEQRVLKGIADIKEQKLLAHSPVTKEIVFSEHDHRMLAIGVVEIEPVDERMRYLEVAYAAPEELLGYYGVPVGILGVPRDDLDAVLMPKERTLEDISKEVRELPKFKIPPKIYHEDETMPKVFPKKPCRFRETQQTTAAREKQRTVWNKFIENVKSLRRSSGSSKTVSFSANFLS